MPYLQTAYQQRWRAVVPQLDAVLGVDGELKVEHLRAEQCAQQDMPPRALERRHSVEVERNNSSDVLSSTHHRQARRLHGERVSGRGGW